MALDKITAADLSGKGNTGRPDVPGLSTAAMQAVMDELSLDVIVPHYNDLIDALTDPAGASEIGSTGGNIQTELDAKANADNVLALDNADTFTPTANYQPATKKYVDDTVTAIGAGDMSKGVYDPDADGSVVTADDALKEHTHLKTGTVHALTNLSGSWPNIRFTATANYAAGDTFTVNGDAVTARQSGGTALTANFFKAGETVCCFFNNDTLKLTFPGGGGKYDTQIVDDLPATLAANTIYYVF